MCLLWSACPGPTTAMQAELWLGAMRLPLGVRAGGTVAGVDGPLTGGTCGGTITRTWNVSDACGNPAIQVTQIITVDDNTPPVIAAPPAAVTVECLANVPPMVSLSWTDNCDAGGTVAGVDGPLTGGTCGGTITRTWNVSDACGNPAIQVTQIITVDDNTPPVIAAPPAAVTVECLANVPPMVSLSWTDNCDAGGTLAGGDAPPTWCTRRRNCGWCRRSSNWWYMRRNNNKNMERF